MTIIITEECNLHCIYCYEHCKTASKISFEQAKSIIDSEFIDEIDRVTLSLFGGEPLLEFSLVKKICEYVWNNNWPCKYRIIIDTNGTQLSDEIKKWINKNKMRLYIGISVDGSKHSHNINRNNSFDSIDIDFFKQLPLISNKMTVSKQSLSNIYNDVVFIQNLGMEFTINLAYGVEWKEEDVKILEEQLDRLINYYKKHPEYKPCSMLNMPIDGISLKPIKKIRKYCGIGTGTVCYDVKGNMHACQVFSPMSIKCEPETKFEEYIDICVLDSKCKKCILVDCCPTCYASNYLESGNFFHKSDVRCKIIKLYFKATAYLANYKIKCGQYEFKSSEHEYLIKCAIYAINTSFNIDDYPEEIVDKSILR